MAIFKQACTWEVTDKLLVVKENKCKCVFSNPNQHLLTKIKVDGCQITDGIRCDYLILDHCHNEYFVELKGKDLPHAVEQLEASIQQLSAPNHTIKKKAIIVSSRNPSNDTSVQRAKAMFKKKYGVELIPKNMQIEITIK
ncbi:hypothetical protein [Bacteroides ovatus]|uniref:hypothetical protein n=1 Tax=Bacteroides ovatus TaxID=28116 RepID=UPI00202FB648|nr:hypothetical protein [Bacteroides ovatus]MCM1720885.1 hypothetical protein [Bacteroides ovatus]MCM1755509.1 hypothetical protein [Bacteroides ovatus]MCM1865901.1 hypothetical protein [Bacteroides ovatus]MCM1910967.1 hypothetical protein [Bacteroides ovatus]